MVGTSRITLSAGSWLAAAVLVCAAAALRPDAARAQTADNLNCNKCVGTKDIGKKAVVKSRIKSNAVTFGKLNPKVEDAIKQDRTFFVTLDSNGATATLVSQGPLRMFARCFINDAGQDRIEIVLTSTANGWFISSSPTVVRSAGEEVILPGIAVAAGTTATTRLIGPLAKAPDGSTIGMIPVLGLGLNIFGHICLMYGSAAAITGSL